MGFYLQPALRIGLLNLCPMETDDFEKLFQVASDPLVWEQPPRWGRFKEEVFRPFFQAAMESGGALVVIENAWG